LAADGYDGQGIEVRMFLHPGRAMVRMKKVRQRLPRPPDRQYIGSAIFQAFIEIVFTVTFFSQQG